MDGTSMLLGRKHGRMHAGLQEKVRKLREVLAVALKFCPTPVIRAAAPLLRGFKIVDPYRDGVVESAASHPDGLLRVDLSSRGFFGRLWWAVGYVFVGIGGAE